MSDLPPFPAGVEGQPSGYAAYPRQPGSDRERVPGSKTTAIWALVLSFIPTPFSLIAAVILAILVLSRSKHSRDVGKGMAISALIIVALWAILLVLAVALTTDGVDRDSSGAVTSRGDVSTTALVPGDCLVDAPSTKAQLTVEVGPCDEPHMQEVYANFDLADGDYPGAKQVIRLAEGGCVKRFADYVGTSLSHADPDLRVFYLHPLKSSWHLTRQVTCLVGTGSSTTGSFKDSATSSS